MYDASSIANALRSDGETRDRINEPTPWAGQKRRTMETEWVLGPGESSHGEPGDIILHLSTGHRGKPSYVGERGNEYSTSLRVQFTDGRIVQTTLAFGTKGEVVSVHRTEGVARFSAKAMREHHAEALRIVAEQRGYIGSVLVDGVNQYLPKSAA